MFKYFFSCPKSEIAADGKLLLDRLGAAAIALRDCRQVQSQCSLTEVTALCELGPGVFIDPHPGDGARVGRLGFLPNWRWIPFATGLVKAGEPIAGLIGFDPKVVFAPELLRRRKMTPGEDVFSLDDAGAPLHRWRIPVARSQHLAYGSLSTYWAPNAAGKLDRVLHQRDQKLWELSGEVWDFLAWSKAIVAGETEEWRPEWEAPWHIERAIEVLGVNYRIGGPEIAALAEMGIPLLTDSFAMTCLHAFVGYAHWTDWLGELKKKLEPDTNRAPADSTSGSGEPAGPCRVDSAEGS